MPFSGSDDGSHKLNNIYASNSTLGGATYFNDVRSSIKIFQIQESAGAQAAQSLDGTKIQNKEILFSRLFNYLSILIVTINGPLR